MKHGYAKNGKRHPLYSKRSDMQQRCHNPSHKAYKYYGSRGINVCKEWLDDTSAFVKWGIENGWEEGLEIERKDNDGDYTPDNCIFVSHSSNMQNRRVQVNNKSGFRGVSYCKRDKAWRAHWSYNGKTKSLGSFKSAMNAATHWDAYNLAHGSLKPFNFEVTNGYR